jgi:bacteriorhodopsin
MMGHIVETQGTALGKAKAEAVGAVVRGAETWQFFAFVFAALVTLALALLDEIPEHHRQWRIAAKIVVFAGLAYLTLVNVRVRDCLVRLLGAFKEDRR